MTLVDQGADVEFSFMPGLPLLTDLAGNPVSLAKDFDADILILQRPLAEWQLVGLRSAQKREIKVVVELDDDIRHVDPRSAFGSQVKPAHQETLKQCCREADLVTVSSNALTRYAPHGRCEVLQNYVPESWTRIEHGPSKPLIGWTGAIGAHADDLKVTHGGVGQAAIEHDATFRCYGSGNEKSRDLIAQTIGAEPEILEWQPRDRYPHELANLTVGIAPLTDTVFNRAKSWLKPLELAAVGVPCIMSPRSEYLNLHLQYGIGILADDRGREWKREVGRLLADDKLRRRIGDRTRQTVRDHLTIENNAWRWVEAWSSIL